MSVVVSFALCWKVFIWVQYQSGLSCHQMGKIRVCSMYFFLLFLEICHAVIISVNLFCRCCRKEVRAHHDMDELHFLFCFSRLLCTLPVNLNAEGFFLSNDVLDFGENLILVIYSWLTFVLWVVYVSCFNISRFCLYLLDKLNTISNSCKRLF